MSRRLPAVILSALLVLAAGCSSLPKGPPPDTELNSRTASLHKLGREHFRAGRLDKAAVYFQKALTMHAAVDDQAGVALCFLSLGRVELARHNPADAEAAFIQAQISARGAERGDLQAQVLAGLAAVRSETGAPSEARRLLEEALDLPLPPEGRIRAVLLHDRGSVLLQMGHTQEALADLQASLDLHSGRHDEAGMASACYTLALAQDALGEASLALASARRALALDRSAANARGVGKDLELLATLHQKAGREDLARDFRRRARLAGHVF